MIYIILKYLKQIRKKLSNKESIIDVDINDIHNVEIIIENDNDMFENEAEIIKNSALKLLENKYVETIEEGVIVFSTMIRGLTYKETQKDENGKVKIILCDIELQKTKNNKR